jgi:uncharacterized membrane protein YfcA
MLTTETAWLPQFFTISTIGLLAGLLGGMLGVGGSIIMIPGLTIFLGPAQHLYQAAAMIANVFVAVPAALRHRRAGAMHAPALRAMLPAAMLFVLVGVWISNRAFFTGVDGERWLRRAFALFLLYVVVLNAQRLFDRSGRQGDPHASDAQRVTPARGGAVGAVMGTVGGLLGIGGGAVAVPLQQVLLHLPLRTCIANSSAIICVSAAVGAVYKNASLPVEYTWQSSLLLAALLAPAAFIGGRIGASLTHRLPLRQVRTTFVLLMIVAAWRMAQLPAPWAWF